jgi:hypothetical protein
MGFSAKQMQALRRSLNTPTSVPATPMAGYYRTSKAGLRFQKPIEFLGLMVGIGKRWKRAVSWREKTAGHSSRFMSPRYALPCMPMAQP